MSDTFQETLDRARTLSYHEQLALIAALSNSLSQEVDFNAMLSAVDEEEVLKRVESYEKGKEKSISGTNFREELRKKYGS